MNPVILFLAGGYSFWVGLVLISTTGVKLSQKKSILILKTVCLLTGLILIAVSVTPIPYWWYAMLISASLYWLWVFRVKESQAEQHGLANRGIWVCVLSALVLELPYAILPRLQAPRTRELVILADSLTAGLKEEDNTWPEILSERVNYSITDLSHVGAVVADGLKMIEDRDLKGKLILIELGGNDLLGSTSSVEFHKSLEALVQRLSEANCSIVMFELPLPPFRYDIAYSQRTLCRQYDVHLIPKRYLLNAIVGEGQTVDSLHLSSKGHAQLADFMEQILKSPFYE